MTGGVVYDCNGATVRVDPRRKEFICYDKKNGEGYRTTNREVAREWCSWSPERRRKYYRELSSMIHA